GRVIIRDPARALRKRALFRLRESAMADDNQNPVFQIQRLYLKDLSLEQRNPPAILLGQAQPQVDITLALAAEPVAEGIYEVTVTATVTNKVRDKVLVTV